MYRAEEGWRATIPSLRQILTVYCHWKGWAGCTESVGSCACCHPSNYLSYNECVLYLSVCEKYISTQQGWFKKDYKRLWFLSRRLRSIALFSIKETPRRRKNQISYQREKRIVERGVNVTPPAPTLYASRLLDIYIQRRRERFFLHIISAAQVKVFRRTVHDSTLAPIYLEQLVLHRTHPLKSEFLLMSC